MASHHFSRTGRLVRRQAVLAEKVGSLAVEEVRRSLRGSVTGYVGVLVR